MDRIDRQILHGLLDDGRAPFRRLADVVGVSEQTVARRYRTLRADGVVRVVVLPDPRAAGEPIWHARIVCRPGTADGVAAALAARDDVSWLSVTAGGGEIVCVVRGDRRAAQGPVLLDRLPRAHEVIGFTASRALFLHQGPDAEWSALADPLDPGQRARLRGPAGERPVPGRTDLQPEDAPLLAELGRDGRAPVATVARATGLPPARVAARIEELLGSGAAFVETDIAAELLGFHAAAYLWLTVAPGELHTVGAALSARPETTFAAAVTGAANLLVVVVCRDDTALYTFVTTVVGARSGVRQVEVVPVLRRVKQAGTRVREGRLDVSVPLR